MTCIYCEKWRNIYVVKKAKNGIMKFCTLKNKNIKDTSNVCKYFKKIGIFYCEENNHFIQLEICLNRRKLFSKNKKYKKLYNNCKKNCRQFKLEIEPLLEKLKKNKRYKRVFIKRRQKQEIKIKRRNIIIIKRR